MENPAVRVRAATAEDGEELLRIYAPYVEKTAVSFEYETPSLPEFRERIRRTLEKYPYLVAESPHGILGYTYAGTFHARPAYDWSVETSVYVGEAEKRHGVGRVLYNALEKSLAAQNIVNLNACIAYPPAEDPFLTEDSVKFHQRMGYRMVGRFYQCGYKFHRWYDMVWMEKLIGPHMANQPAVKPFGEIRGFLKKEYGIL